jgi:hypothetical protein
VALALVVSRAFPCVEVENLYSVVPNSCSVEMTSIGETDLSCALYLDALDRVQAFGEDVEQLNFIGKRYYYVETTWMESNCVTLLACRVRYFERFGSIVPDPDRSISTASRNQLLPHTDIHACDYLLMETADDVVKNVLVISAI